MGNFSMHKSDIIKMAHKNLWRRKVRTFLTVLGVLIGTTSIIVMISLGIGLTETSKKTMEQWGSLNLIEIYSGMRWDNEGNPIGQSNPLNDEAVQTFKTMPGVVGVSPGYNIGGMAKWGRKEGHLQIVGLDASQMPNMEFKIGEGRLLNAEDRFNIVVGREVGQQFWDPKEMERMGGHFYMGPSDGENNPTLEMLNQRVSVDMYNRNGQKRTYNFTVVGILSEENRDKSWQSYAPIGEIKRIKEFMNAGPQGGNQGGRGGVTVPGGRSRNNEGPDPNDYDFIWVRTNDVSITKELSKEIRDMGYQAWAMADNLEGIEEQAKVMQAILGGIGGITLLVAALGIINTMIMSIYERTREIGIMKVIGASFFDIRLLFLTEAGLIGLFGGVIGLAFSYGASWVINHFGASYIGGGMMGQEVTISLIPPWLAIFALIFSILIGVVAGIYPANRAVKLSPISAIRNE